jgi:hypothetical protein
MLPKPPSQLDGFVYAVKGEGGLIKIGQTQRLKQRLGALRGASLTVEVLAYGWSYDRRRAERDAHERLSAFRVPRRELFHPEAPVLAFVDELCSWPQTRPAGFIAKLPEREARLAALQSQQQDEDFERVYGEKWRALKALEASVQPARDLLDLVSLLRAIFMRAKDECRHINRWVGKDVTHALARAECIADLFEYALGEARSRGVEFKPRREYREFELPEWPGMMRGSLPQWFVDELRDAERAERASRAAALEARSRMSEAA